MANNYKFRNIIMSILYQFIKEKITVISFMILAFSNVYSLLNYLFNIPNLLIIITIIVFSISFYYGIIIGIEWDKVKRSRS